jgi:hypothetical protein
MVAKVQLDEQLLNQLQASGEVQVEDSRGIPLVLMTVDARQQLAASYDATDWTSEEMLSIASKALEDPEGWGEAAMGEYDKVYGHLFTDNGQGS